MTENLNSSSLNKVEPEQINAEHDSISPEHRLLKKFGPAILVGFTGSIALGEKVVTQGEFNPADPAVVVFATVATFGITKAIRERTRE